jgi:hypothetical protein
MVVPKEGAVPVMEEPKVEVEEVIPIVRSRGRAVTAEDSLNE